MNEPAQDVDSVLEVVATLKGWLSELSAHDSAAPIRKVQIRWGVSNKGEPATKWFSPADIVDLIERTLDYREGLLQRRDYRVDQGEAWLATLTNHLHLGDLPDVLQRLTPPPFITYDRGVLGEGAI